MSDASLSSSGDSFDGPTGANGFPPSGNRRSADEETERRSSVREETDEAHRLRERLSAYREERREERPPRRPKVAVPSLFTLLNLFCGFLALTQILEAEFVRACWLVLLAGFFDALDGPTARLAGAQSGFGVELDSLSDVVSFGLAPALLVWTYGLREFGPLGLLVAALPALCGAVRLARYNVGFDGEKEDSYRGLPVPAQAVTIIALILTLERAAWFSRSSEGNLSVLIPVVLVLAGLMVSNVRFDAFPTPTPSYAKAHPYKIAAYVVGLAMLPFLQELAVLIFLGGYILAGLLNSAWNLTRAILDAEP